MTLWKRKDDWVGSQVDDQYVMIHLDSGRYIALNQTATEAWRALETPCTRDDLVAALVGQYKISAQDCGRAVDSMLDKMEQLKLIEREDATSR